MIETVNKEEIFILVDRAVAGDKNALEELLLSVQDLIFNLSLRMLGTVTDAQDATQEILIRIMTNLTAFRKESTFSTWVFRIAVNHLKNYKKSMFRERPLSFEYYGDDILNGHIDDLPDLTQNVDRKILSEELKMSCTNVMLQCLDADSRCIFILGTMFGVDSRVAGEVLEISPQAYRQRLCRIRAKMAEFLDKYCGAGGKGCCSCEKRVNYAIGTRRLNPKDLEYLSLEHREESLLLDCKAEMERLDDLSIIFSTLPAYRTREKEREFIKKLLKSDEFSSVMNK